jgi:hypothetical protein
MVLICSQLGLPRSPPVGCLATAQALCVLRPAVRPNKDLETKIPSGFEEIDNSLF